MLKSKISLLENELRRVVRLYGTTFHAKIEMEPSRQSEIFQEADNSTIGAHPGQTKTYEKIRERYFWPNMADQIREWVSNLKTTTYTFYNNT